MITTYKGYTIRILKSAIGNKVTQAVVLGQGENQSFTTIKSAKAFIKSIK